MSTEQDTPLYRRTADHERDREKDARAEYAAAIGEMTTASRTACAMIDSALTGTMDDYQIIRMTRQHRAYALGFTARLLGVVNALNGVIIHDLPTPDGCTELHMAQVCKASTEDSLCCDDANAAALKCAVLVTADLFHKQLGGLTGWRALTGALIPVRRF